MKILPKKRLDQLKLSFASKIQEASLSKQQIFWYAASLAVYGWFMFWIAYDLFVWHKSFKQGNVINYIGAAASIAVIWAEAKLLKPKPSKTKFNPPIQPKQPKSQTKQTKQTKTKQNQPHPAKPSPQQKFHTNHATCILKEGYLKDYEPSTQMPNECLTCTNLIQCLNNQKQTTTNTNQTTQTKKPSHTPKTKRTKQTTKKTSNPKPKTQPKTRKKKKTPSLSQQILTEPDYLVKET